MLYTFNSPSIQPLAFTTCITVGFYTLYKAPSTKIADHTLCIRDGLLALHLDVTYSVVDLFVLIIRYVLHFAHPLLQLHYK